MTIEYKIKIENGTLTVTQQVDLGNSSSDASSAPPGEALPNSLAEAQKPVDIKPAKGGDGDEPKAPIIGGGIPIAGDGQVLVFGPVIFDLSGLIKKEMGHSDR